MCDFYFTSSHEILEDNWANLIRTHANCSHTLAHLETMSICFHVIRALSVLLNEVESTALTKFIGKEIFPVRETLIMYTFINWNCRTLFIYVSFDLFSFFFFFWLIFFWAYVLPFYLACTYTCVSVCAKTRIHYVIAHFMEKKWRRYRGWDRERGRQR